MIVKSVISFNRHGEWAYHTLQKWSGFYFFETVLDWSLFKGMKGKLYVETMHSPEEGGEIALGYQQAPPREGMEPVEGSIIKTYPSHHGARWLLAESEWFNLPEQSGVSCLWIIGKAEPNKKISIALATLVVADE